MIAVFVWFGFVAACGFLAFFAHRLAIPFAAIAAVMYPVAFLPLGHPSLSDLPAGQHKILGARIDYQVAIYVMIDGDEPRLYWMPYSEEQAKALQSAMEGEEGAVVNVRRDGFRSEGEFEKAPDKDQPKA